ncbi:MAG: phosphodiester glycosidase family protein [Ferruginibacter sp.]
MTNIRPLGLFPLIASWLVLFAPKVNSQVKWINVDTGYAPLPTGFHIYKSADTLGGSPFIAYYTIADIKDKNLSFTTDTTFKRRFTPQEFYEKNGRPLLVVNTTFFSFATNQNLNVVIKNGRLVSYNIHSTPGKGKDTFTYRHSFNGALGISKKRTADIAWVYSDSSKKTAYASQSVIEFLKDSIDKKLFEAVIYETSILGHSSRVPAFRKWKMQAAVGGGPVLVQNGAVKITNNEELKFSGKAIDDKHPRTLMGYTKDNKLIIMVIEGRYPGVAEGANLVQAAQLLKSVGCIEALNLDGGGSSCLLVNGKETIKPSDKGLERAVPSVFIINARSE